ncbi:MAG: TIGR02206 family membrane protein [Lutibacter sp.]|nr:MAG: TIGR02206 family membrane protein [Lutibacter sp.]
MNESIFLKDNNEFVMFGMQHLVATLFFILFGFLLIRWAKKQPKYKQIKVGNTFAFSLSFVVILWTVIKIYQRGFDIQHDLPFHLCNFIALFLPIFSITRKKIYYEILLFWILAGTSQAVITPDIRNGFPHYVFLKYWYVHAGLVVFILYATTIYGMRPTIKSVFKSFAALLVYFLLMLVINKIVGANYLYLNHKPEGASLLNYLGEWPYYIFGVMIIVLPLFFLIYLPFHLTRNKQ